MLHVAEHFEQSDTGRQRRENEDNYLARSPLFVVADGMGGAQAGEVASRLAAEAFAAGLPDGASYEERLAARALEANRRIHAVSREDRDRAGMGTTLTAAYVDGDEVALAHVGDSRAYLWRERELTRLTRDHTLVDELVRRGRLTEQEAAEHPQRSIITRALGPEPDVEVDTLTHRARAGDVLLLCSDGLTSMVREEDVADILAGAGSLREAGRALVEAANAAGGRDNITVVLFRLEEGDPADAAPEDPTAVTEQPTAAGTAALRTADVRRAVAREERAASPSRAPEDRATMPLPRRVKLFAATAATLIVVGVLGLAGWLASRAVFFVGTDQHGMVSVFRGVPWELPGGIRLYERWYVSGVPAAAVPPARRERLLDHRLRSRDDVGDLIDQLELGKLGR